MASIPVSDATTHVDVVLDLLTSQPPIAPPAPALAQAPALVVPSIFEPALCRELIALYDRDGGRESGLPSLP